MKYIKLYEDLINFDDWIDDETEYWINDFIINKKWIKVYKKDWGCFINELYKNGIIYLTRQRKLRHL